MTAGNAIYVCWLIFAGVWLLLAFSTKRTAERQSTAERLTHNLWLWIAFVILFWHGNHPGPGAPLFPPSLGLTVAALVVTVAGLLLMVWARIVLGGNWSGVVTFKEGHELIVVGPYRLVRNPIYTGLLLLMLGTALYQNRWPAFAAVALAFVSLWIKLRQEERVLERHFPESFPDYRRRVKSLVPFLF